MDQRQYKVTHEGDGNFTVREDVGFRAENTLALILAAIVVVVVVLQAILGAIGSFFGAIWSVVGPVVPFVVAAPVVLWWTRELVALLRQAGTRPIRPITLAFATPYLFAMIAAIVIVGLRGDTSILKPVVIEVPLSILSIAWVAWLVGYVPVRFVRAWRGGVPNSRRGWGLLVVLDVLTVFVALTEPMITPSGFAFLEWLVRAVFPIAFGLGWAYAFLAPTRPRTEFDAMTEPTPDGDQG